MVFLASQQEGGVIKLPGAAVQVTDNLCKLTAHAPTHNLLFHFPHIWQLF